MALVGECEMIKVVLPLKGYGKGLSVHLLEMAWKEKIFGAGVVAEELGREEWISFQ